MILQRQFGNKTDILMNKNKLIIDTRQTLETRFQMFMCGHVKNAETDMCQHEIVTIKISLVRSSLQHLFIS